MHPCERDRARQDRDRAPYSGPAVLVILAIDVALVAVVRRVPPVTLICPPSAATGPRRPLIVSVTPGGIEMPLAHTWYGLPTAVHCVSTVSAPQTSVSACAGSATMPTIVSATASAIAASVDPSPLDAPSPPPPAQRPRCYPTVSCPCADDRCVELELFDEVAEVLRGLVPDAVGRGDAEPTATASRCGSKRQAGAGALRGTGDRRARRRGRRRRSLWRSAFTPSTRSRDNDDVIERLLTEERQWRKALGVRAVVGPFLGRPRRVAPLVRDVGRPRPRRAWARRGGRPRLADYVTVLEPLRRPTR